MYKWNITRKPYTKKERNAQEFNLCLNYGKYLQQKKYFEIQGILLSESGKKKESVNKLFQIRALKFDLLYTVNRNWHEDAVHC